MDRFLYRWALDLHKPFALEEQRIPENFLNPAYDMHAAVHAGILLDGELGVLKEKYEVFVTASWQLHGNISSRRGAHLLLVTFQPDALLNTLTGDKELLRTLLYMPCPGGFLVLRNETCRQLSEAFVRRIQGFSDGYTPAAADRKTWLAIADFIGDLADTAAGEFRADNKKFLKLRPVFELLGNCRQFPVLPAQAARSCCLSESYFHHLFKECMGISFSLYELYFRLNGAVADLSRGAAVKEIAEDWGFCDTSHFSNTFKRYFGMPPSQYRGK
ncbi:MAG: helix-turn-helix transcriptional regulator [Lentisphaeria bacterium]|nr:helix-turn-helix transcriptional regulator [Lentisphaeria bacterium]